MSPRATMQLQEGRLKEINDSCKARNGEAVAKHLREAASLMVLIDRCVPPNQEYFTQVDVFRMVKGAKEMAMDFVATLLVDNLKEHHSKLPAEDVLGEVQVYINAFEEAENAVLDALGVPK